MKKTITRIWGVGLILVLMVSLLLSAAPVSAKDLKFGAEDIPDTDGKVILDASNILDLAVAADGETIYAAVGTSTIYRSTNRGESWSAITVQVNSTTYAVSLVAVAPDDASFIVVAKTDTPIRVLISEDAGAEFEDLALGTEDAMDPINGLAISAESSDKHYVAVAGVDSGSDGDVYVFDVGASVPVWTSTQAKAGWPADEPLANAVAFSPNFASDKIMLAITANTTNNKVHYNIYSFSSNKWNEETGLSSDFPVNLTYSGDTVATLDSASISPDPEFLGSDDSMCIAFVGLTVDAGADTDTSGTWRVDFDDFDEVKKGQEIHSVSFDGTNLVAGHYEKNTVRRSADPLSTEPTVKGSATLKSPGINTVGVNEKTVVAWAGSDVVAGTSGDESAFAVSRDNGKSFNDISLIDTALSYLRDVAVSADGSNVYLTTDDGTNMSVWRLADDAWERVLAVPAKQDFIARTAPDDMDVVFVADKVTKVIYYSADAGETRWQTRSCKVNIQDLAVETDGQTVYAVNAAGSVSKSSNNGFTWASSVASKTTNHMLISLGEDLLLAGSTTGEASYSTDGNVTWTKLDSGMTSAVTNIQVIASGLDDGDFVYAAPVTTGDQIYRWELGEDDEWGDIKDDVDTGYGIYGLALDGKILYALAASTSANASKIYRSFNATKDAPTFSTDTNGCTTAEFSIAPSALRMSAGSNVLWAIDVEGDALMTYKDTIATVAPVLASPPDGYEIQVNPVSGETAAMLFSWVCPSDRITLFDLQIAIDSGMDALVYDTTGPGVDAWDEGDVVNFSRAGAYFNPGTTYYWRVRINKAGPFRSPYSDIWTLQVVEAEGLPPVTVEIPPPPEVTVTVPAPEVTVTVPPMVTVPPAPAPVAPAYIWGIIVIGAILVVALIVLIVRTRRVV